MQSSGSATYTNNSLNNGDSINVDVKNTNGCIKTSAAVYITVNPVPSGTLTPSATTICVGDNVTFTASGTFTSYEFKVNATSVQGPGSSNIFSSTTLTNPSVVTVIATNAFGCSAPFNSVSITVNAPPNGTITTTENSDIANDYTICDGAPVTFTATAGFTNYKFYLRNTSTLLQGSPSNIYTSTTLVRVIM